MNFLEQLQWDLFLSPEQQPENRKHTMISLISSLTQTIIMVHKIADLFFGMNESLENERCAQLGCHDGHALLWVTARKSCWNVAAHLPHEAEYQHTHSHTPLTINSYIHITLI